MNSALAECIDQSLVQSQGSKIDQYKASVVNEKGTQNLIKDINSDSEITILHFWATWCAPCLKELPELDASIQQAKEQGYKVLPINTDANSLEKSTALFSRLKIANLPLLFDTDNLFYQFKLLGMPATIVLDADGLEIKRVYGALPWECEELLSELSH